MITNNVMHNYLCAALSFGDKSVIWFTDVALFGQMEKTQNQWSKTDSSLNC